jgi:hypothetical protein
MPHSTARASVANSTICTAMEPSGAAARTGRISGSACAPRATRRSRKRVWSDYDDRGVQADGLRTGLIRDHFKRKTLKYKLGPSSEDIWESRDQKLAWGDAFSEPTEAPAGSDEEWNRRERLRRQGRVEGTI